MKNLTPSSPSLLFFCVIDTATLIRSQQNMAASDDDDRFGLDFGQHRQRSRITAVEEGVDKEDSVRERKSGEELDNKEVVTSSAKRVWSPMLDFLVSDQSIVRFNVGGVMFATSRETIFNDRDRYLMVNALEQNALL